jgi:hypothetical protein
MQDTASLPWTLDSIDFSRFDAARARANDDLICLICASSFIESGSDLYTRNLIEHYADDAEVQAWLREHWEREELQHGHALATYVRHAWPDFDWDTAFRAFFDEYGPLCTAEALEPSRGLELAARCVVETGTSSLYRAIHAQAEEPVLKELTAHIKNDEVRHYKYFYRYFRLYEARERNGRRHVFGALWRRLLEMRNEDGDIALRHVFAQRCPQVLRSRRRFRTTASRVQRLVKQHLPVEMTVKMLLRPLDLPPRLNQGIQTPLTWLAQRLVLR